LPFSLAQKCGLLFLIPLRIAPSICSTPNACRISSMNPATFGMASLIDPLITSPLTGYAVTGAVTGGETQEPHE
jgi:hypothetical protein